jgi:hypothetical protein
VAERAPNDNESATKRFRCDRRVADPARALTTDSFGPAWSSGAPLVAVIAVAPFLLSPWAVSDASPYVEARHEWNDRYLDLVRERRVSQAVAGAELVVTLVLAGGLAWVGRQRKTVPYSWRWTPSETPSRSSPPTPAEHPADERVVRYQLAAFIRWAWHECRAHLQIRPGYKAAFLANSTRCSPRTQGTTARCTARRSTCGPLLIQMLRVHGCGP